MSKQWYELTFEPIQPLHIGMGSYGVMAPTRLFIPGYTMWGALTAGLGRFLGKSESELNLDPFQEISNFYPVIGSEILSPNYRNGELCFGNYTERQFRYEFTDTIMSTAILAETQSAKEKTLHEIEILLQKSKTNSGDLFWKGILLMDLDGDNSKVIADYLKGGLTLQVGGERTYGLGLLRLANIKDLKPDKWNVSDSTKNEINVDGKSAHYVTSNHINKGTLEPYYKIEQKENSQPIKIHFSQIYTPGCEGKGITGKLYKGIIREII